MFDIFLVHLCYRRDRYCSVYTDIYIQHTPHQAIFHCIFRRESITKLSQSVSRKNNDSFSLPSVTQAMVFIYDVSGRIINRFHCVSQNDGNFSVLWDGKDEKGKAVASGIYMYKVTAAPFSQVRKMVLLK